MRVAVLDGMTKRHRLKMLAAAASLFSCSPSTCVARGTRVRVRGGERLIEALEVGDLVMCIDPVTGLLHETRVLRMVSGHRECIRLEGSGFALTCTPDHPLYDPKTRAFHDAGDWALGRREFLLTVPASDEAVALEMRVTHRALAAGIFEVFDVTVESEFHTFVANGVAVHNKSIHPWCQTSDGGWQQLPSLAECDCGGAQPSTAICATATSPAQCECADDGGVDRGSTQMP
jgi:hypothetical protein